MASENSKQLQQALAPALKQHGFQKSGATWRKVNDEVVTVLDIQGSQWGPSFYINLGAYLRELGDRARPAERHCHLRTRLTALVPDRGRLCALLDFESSIPEELRARELESLVVEHALPWLDAVSTIDGARRYCASPARDALSVSAEARALFDRAHGS
jgi:hypothetical protein